MKTILAALLLSSVITVQAALVPYLVVFTGPKEFPVNNSPAVGTGLVIYNDVNHTLQMQATFSGLQGGVTQSHIHAPTTAPFFQNSGVAVGNSSLPGFPLTITSGVYSNTLDLTSSAIYTTPFINASGGTTAGAEANLAATMAANKSYWNIHSSVFTGGEIRGFLIRVPDIKITSLKLGTNLTLTSTLLSTNGLALAAEFSTNLLSSNWAALTIQSNTFLNGTNEIICGKPSENFISVRLRAQILN